MNRVILAYLFREKHRILLTLLVIIITLSGAMVLSGTSVTIQRSVERSYSKEYLESIVVTAPKARALTDTDFNTIQNTPNVQGYVAFVPFMAKAGGSPKGAAFFYVSNPELLDSWLDLEYSGEFSEGNALLRKGVLTNVSELYAEEPEPVGINLSPLYQKNLLIAYVYLSEEGGFMIEPVTSVFDVLQKMQSAKVQDLLDNKGEKFLVSGTFNPENSSIPYFKSLDIMMVKKPETAKVAIVKTDLEHVDQVSSALAAKGLNALSLKKEYEKIVEKVSEISGMFAMFSWVVGGMTVLITWFMLFSSAKNDSKSIGLLRAFGWKDSEITRMFLFRTAVILTLSLLISLGLVALFSSSSNYLVRKVFGSSVRLSDMLEAGKIILLATVLAGLAGTLASLRQSLKHPLSSLLK